jgi:hypothetical protein
MNRHKRRSVFKRLCIVTERELSIGEFCNISGNIATADLKKLLELLGENFGVDNFENLVKSADPNNKGIVSFSKFVILVEINKQPEEFEPLDPTGESLHLHYTYTQCPCG